MILAAQFTDFSEHVCKCDQSTQLALLDDVQAVHAVLHKLVQNLHNEGTYVPSQMDRWYQDSVQISMSADTRSGSLHTGLYVRCVTFS